MKTVTMVLASILWLGTHVASQGVTADEYPSEDELLSALQRGEIDDLQYERLREILGLDDAELTEAALDEIPDIDDVLHLFGLTRADLLSGSEPQPRPHDRPRVHVSHRYLQKATAAADSRYRTAIDLYPTNRVTAGARVDRTYSGRERIVARNVHYRNSRGAVREAILGTYAKRFGLGTVAGYRGKLFDGSDRLDAESFTYPDFGGGNGLYLHLERDTWSMQTSCTVQRDQGYSLTGGALMLERRQGGGSLGLLLGLSRLTSRVSGERVVDCKPAVHMTSSYRVGSVEAELAAQAGARRGFGAVVIEGEHHAEQSLIRYDLWIYGRSYLDVTAGSRSGPLSRRDTVDMVEFGFATRRAGAHGGRLRISNAIGNGLELQNRLLVHAFNSDTVRVDVTTAVGRNVADKSAALLEYRYRFTRRSGASTPEIREQRALGQIEMRQGRLRGRGYVAFTKRTASPDYLSVLARIRIDTSTLGQFDFGTTFARLTTVPLRNDYGSVYARCRQELRPGLSWAVRLFHRYSRASSHQHETTITLEVEGVL